MVRVLPVLILVWVVIVLSAWRAAVSLNGLARRLPFSIRWVGLRAEGEEARLWHLDAFVASLVLGILAAGFYLDFFSGDVFQQFLPVWAE